MSASPLGRYSAIAAAIVLVGVIAAAVVGHLIGGPDPFLDGLAYTAFGIIAGTAGSLTMLNGTVRRTTEQDAELLALRVELARLNAAAAPAERKP